MSELEGLIAMVEASEAGNKELDADIFLALSPDAFGADILRRERDTGNLMWTTGGASFQYPQGGGVSFPIPAVTSSLDAALKLVEAKLPRDWIVGFEWGQTGTLADAWVRWKFSEYSSEAQGRTPALAICAALLKALHGAQQ